MKSYVESKVVDFSGATAGAVIHHFMFVRRDEYEWIEAMENLVANGVIDPMSINQTEDEEGNQGFIASWYSCTPLTPIAPEGWEMCYEEHTCTTYYSPILGRYVCDECNPFSDIHTHRPFVAEWVKRIRRRVEDALRKSPDTLALFNLARKLGVRMD